MFYLFVDCVVGSVCVNEIDSLMVICIVISSFVDVFCISTTFAGSLFFRNYRLTSFLWLLLLFRSSCNSLLQIFLKLFLLCLPVSFFLFLLFITFLDFFRSSLFFLSFGLLLFFATFFGVKSIELDI